jgi:hypothetical protein
MAFGYKCPKCGLAFPYTPNRQPAGHCGHDCLTEGCGTRMRWDDSDSNGQAQRCTHGQPLDEPGSMLPLREARAGWG